MKLTSVLPGNAYNVEIAHKLLGLTEKSKGKVENVLKTTKSSNQPRLNGQNLCEGSSSELVDRSKPAQDRFAYRWNKKCLRSKRRGIHRVKNYKITSLQKQKVLLRKYRDENCNLLKSMTVSKASDRRYNKVIINDQVSCLVLWGYGKHYSAILSSLLIKLLKSSEDVEAKTSSALTEFQLDVYDDKEATSA